MWPDSWSQYAPRMVGSMLAFALVVGLLTIAPGIDTALVLRSSVTEGRKAAFATLAGISSGVLVWGVAAAVGISALLTASELAYNAVRLAGAGYMIYLGLSFIWHSRTAKGIDVAAEDKAESSRAEITVRAAFSRGFLTNVLNPKVGVFYIAVLPQFLPPDVPAALGGLLLAFVHFTEGWIWLSILIVAMSFMRSWLQRPKVEAWTDRMTGAVLIAFGLRVAAEW